MKLKVKGTEGGVFITSKELGELSVYNDIPIVYLDKGQTLEIVSRARVGTGLEHAKFIPGLFSYKN